MRLRWGGLLLIFCCHAAAQPVPPNEAATNSTPSPASSLATAPAPTPTPTPTPTRAETLARYTAFRPSQLMDWHPTNHAALVLRRAADITTWPQLHLVPSPGAPLEQLTNIDGVISHATFLRTNTVSASTVNLILVRHDQRGDGRFRLYWLDVTTQKVSPLSPAPMDADVPQWTASGDRFFFVARATANARNRAAGVTLYMVDGNTSNTLVPIPIHPAVGSTSADAVERAWQLGAPSPDGKKIAIIERTTPSPNSATTNDAADVATNAAALWTFDIASGQRIRLATDATEAVEFSSPVFTPDGGALLVIARRAGQYRRLIRVDIATGVSTVLTAHLNADVLAFAISETAQRIAVVMLEGGSGVLRFFALDSGTELLRPALLPGAITNLRWRIDPPQDRATGVSLPIAPSTSSSSSVAGAAGASRVSLGFSLASTRSAADAYQYDINTTKLTRWTNASVPGLNAFLFVEPQPIMLTPQTKTDPPAFIGAIYRPDLTQFPGRRPVVIRAARTGTDERTPLGFLGRDNYLVNEMGIAVIALTATSTPEGLSTLLDWIASQPELDANAVVLTLTTNGYLVPHTRHTPPTPPTPPTPHGVAAPQGLTPQQRERLLDVRQSSSDDPAAFIAELAALQRTLDDLGNTKANRVLPTVTSVER